MAPICPLPMNHIILISRQRYVLSPSWSPGGTKQNERYLFFRIHLIHPIHLLSCISYIDVALWDIYWFSKMAVSDKEGISSNML